MPTSSHPPSCTNTSIVTHDASIASSVRDTYPIYDLHSQSVTPNCAPVLDKYANTRQSKAPMPITHKLSPPECFNTTLSSNNRHNSLKAKDKVILLKTINAFVVVREKILLAPIFLRLSMQLCPRA